MGQVSELYAEVERIRNAAHVNISFPAFARILLIRKQCARSLLDFDPETDTWKALKIQYDYIDLEIKKILSIT